MRAKKGFYKRELEGHADVLLLPVGKVGGKDREPAEGGLDEAAFTIVFVNLESAANLIGLSLREEKDAAVAAALGGVPPFMVTKVEPGAVVTLLRGSLDLLEPGDIRGRRG